MCDNYYKRNQYYRHERTNLCCECVKSFIWFMICMILFVVVVDILYIPNKQHLSINIESYNNFKLTTKKIIRDMIDMW